MAMLVISALAVHTQIGVHAWEQRIKQKLLIDIKLPLENSDCEDKLEKTIDYQVLCERVTDFVESKSFALIETVAHEVVLLIKELFQVVGISVAVAKPQAIANAGNVQVILEE